MNSAMKEVRLTLPMELVTSCKGLGIDIGCSLLKVVYRSKEDKDELDASKDAKYGQARLLLLPRTGYVEALDYVRQRADITRNGDEPTLLCTTGFGCTEFGKTIIEQLNIRLVQLNEFDCFVKAFVYLSLRLPRTQFLEPFIENAVVEPMKIVQSHFIMFTQMTNGIQLNEETLLPDMETIKRKLQVAVGRPSAAALQVGDVPLAEAEPDMFPCILAMCGSGSFCFKVEKDGSYKTVDFSGRAGRSFVGVASMMIGCKNFSELTELASRGSPRDVDEFTDDRKSANSADDDDSLYVKTEQGESAPMFPFGKAVGKTAGDFKREDLARSWVNYCITDLVQFVHHMCLLSGTRRAFFCGGFIDSEFIRELITTQFVVRNLMSTTERMDAFVQFEFVRPGAHLGAIGCLINNIDACSDR